MYKNYIVCYLLTHANNFYTWNKTFPFPEKFSFLLVFKCKLKKKINKDRQCISFISRANILYKIHEIYTEYKWKNKPDF